MAGELSDLEASVLRSVRAGMGVEDMARGAGVSPAALGKAIATLQLKGMLNDDGTVSERGEEALKSK